MSTDYERAVSSWLARARTSSITSHEPFWPTHEEAAIVIGALRAQVRASGGGDWADDATSEAVVTMANAISAGRVAMDRNPSAYLRRIAINRAADMRRADNRDRERRLRGVDDKRALNEDEIAAFVDRDASAQMVGELLSQVDGTTARVLAAFLDLAQLGGRRPSAESVALAAGVSRKTVFKSLARAQVLLGRLVDRQGDS